MGEHSKMTDLALAVMPVTLATEQTKLKEKTLLAYTTVTLGLGFWTFFVAPICVVLIVVQIFRRFCSELWIAHFCTHSLVR